MLEHEIYGWLKSLRIGTPDYRLFPLDKELGSDYYPVALKIQSSSVIHKSEVGGVAVNLPDSLGLNKAKDIMLAELMMHGIHLGANDRFMVSRIYTGVELFFGIVEDPVFSKVIVFGAGGVFTELFKDICFIDSEADEQEIIDAVGQTRISTIFKEGFRGKKYCLRPVIELVKKLQKADVEEMDLNPVILHDGTLTVVDARPLPVLP